MFLSSTHQPMSQWRAEALPVMSCAMGGRSIQGQKQAYLGLDVTTPAIASRFARRNPEAGT